jgi:hypothetical protein
LFVCLAGLLWGGPVLADEQSKELQPRRVTLKTDKMPLRDVLKELTKQTQIPIADRRTCSGDVVLKLDLRNVTFWEALDAIAKEADVRVSLHERGGIGLVDGPHLQMPVSYDGLFRTVVRRLTTVHDLETDAHFLIATLEIAWEPRFRPLFIESRPQGLVVQDDQKKELAAGELPAGKLPIQGGVSALVEIRLAAPPRSVSRLGLLKGSLSLVGSTKMLEFEFDTVAKEKAAKAPKQTKEGVTVRLSRIDLSEKTHWTIVVSLEYPSEGPKFESFQSWVVNNEIFLKHVDGKPALANNGYSLDSLGSSKAVMTYYFTDQLKKQFGGRPEDWKMLYRAPAPFAEVPVKFEFKDISLP